MTSEHEQDQQETFDPNRIERHIYIAAPAERVWDALVTPSIASKYFIVPLLEAEPHPGGRIVYGPEGGPPIVYTVLECDPGKRIVHTFNLPAFDEPPTRVTYQVEAVGEICKLTLIHEGFPSRNRTFDEVNGGWNFILCNLKTLLETGNSMPPPSDW